MLNKGVCMYLLILVLAYCDESLFQGNSGASCIKRADTYFGRRSASLIKEFWILCILLMTVMVGTIQYSSNICLTHCL